MKVTLFGKEYNAVIADSSSSPSQASRNRKKEKEWERPVWKTRPEPKDLHKEMNKQRVSRHYITALMTKLSLDFKSDGAELVRSDGDNYVSIAGGDVDIIIAPIFAEDSVVIAVERIDTHCSFKSFGSVTVDGEATYKSMLELLRKFVQRAKTR